MRGTQNDRRNDAGEPLIMEINVPEFTPLEPCHRCDGDGRIYEDGGKRPICWVCKGNKYLLTEDGNKLMQFLRFVGLEPKDPREERLRQ